MSLPRSVRDVDTNERVDTNGSYTAVPWVGLLYVAVAFPGYIHLLFVLIYVWSIHLLAPRL